jgi:hypothetical protein
MSGWKLQLKVLKQIPFNLMLRENKHKYSSIFLSLFNRYLSLPQLSGAGPLWLLRLPVTIYEPCTANCFSKYIRLPLNNIFYFHLQYPECVDCSARTN